MRALTVRPGEARSARLEQREAPADGVIVETVAIGVCGTDREIVDGLRGTAPEGTDRLVLGHESVGRVREAPPGSDLSPGDLVVGIVRRPDPVPCPPCAVGEWDMCRNGLYREHGIKELDGFAADLWRAEPGELVRIDAALGATGVLLEPTSVVAKAWEHVDRIGARAAWSPRRVLVTGAGPIGLLAALLARLRGYEVHLLDVIEEGAKPELARALGAAYHTRPPRELSLSPDVVIECTGVGRVVLDVMDLVAPGGIVCLTGISASSRKISTDLDAWNRNLVLDNNVVFGSVNANRRHYRAAAAALAAADHGWLSALVTRRFPPERFADALERDRLGVKTVIEFAA